ncbi:uncharacterized protein [Typha angustifolia]|uniref:uncharacterized protein isoform X1 n=3 Tax=Typha angustifolia TaxID=59011 RepID=UPI003C2E29D9
MHCISHPSSAAIFWQNRHVIMRSSLYGFSRTSWKSGIWRTGIKVLNLDFSLAPIRVQRFSSRSARTSRSAKVNQPPPMDEESEAFYVVRKGDVIGIYKSLTDCQAQVSSSVCDPSVSVYKGYALQKDTEEYLASRGLKNALYSINAVDVKEDLFGNLVPCPFQQPDGLAFLVDRTSKKTSTLKRSQDMVNKLEAVGSTSTTTEQSHKHLKLGFPIEQHPKSFNYMSCILEFDGASKGNPGKSGAGAVLRAEDGSVISRIREGLGAVTNNVAEYRALILGLKFALRKGFRQIRVQGDSKLVCNQVEDLWRTRNQNMADLCLEVKALRDMFLSFEINHVKREFNADADAQANIGVELPTGEIQEESGEPSSL